MTLSIAMPGPHLAMGAKQDPSRHDALPPLPVLTNLLARGRRLPCASDWRGGVLEMLGKGSDIAVPDVVIAAQALLSRSRVSGVCYAAPLHVVAGMSRVHLPPDGWLELEESEAGRWREAFNREFGGPDLHLHALASGWLMEATCAAGARDAAPEELLGCPLERSAAHDEAERMLRRLGAEVEMWLAGHELNRQREARQLPPLNTFWFWGGARARPLPPPASRLRNLLVAGEPDPWAAGLAAHLQLTAVRATDWQSLPFDDTLLVLLPPRSGLAAAHWQALESQWIAPAERALRDGVITTLRLQIGNTAWQLPGRSPLAWLRRRRPWYELVAA